MRFWVYSVPGDFLTHRSGETPQYGDPRAAAPPRHPPARLFDAAAQLCRRPCLAESTPAPAGTTARRLLDSEWIGDLYAAVNKPDNELKLVLELSAPATVETHDLAESEALSVLVEGGSHGVERIEVMLIDQNYRDTFFVLVADLV